MLCNYQNFYKAETLLLGASVQDSNLYADDGKLEESEEEAMDERKMDMVFFMTYENGKNLTFEEIEKIAEKYSARSLWYLWQHAKRYRNYLVKQAEMSAKENFNLELSVIKK